MSEIDKTKNATVYCHVNKFNGKIYIGITTQDKMWKRWGSNGAGYKPSGKVYESHFYNAIQRYGWDNFEHIILIDNITLELAEIIERELINKYNTTDEQYGYNLALGGIGGSGGYKKVNQYDLDGNYIKTWNCISDAGHFIKRNPNGIAACCKGYRKTLGGYQWKFFDDVNSTDNIDAYSNSKSVIQYSKNGEFIKIWKSAFEASKELDICLSGIQRSCKGDGKTSGGYQWRYCSEKNNFTYKNISPCISTTKKVNQFDMDWNYIKTWDSISEAEQTLNIAGGTITKCCKGQWKHGGGYKWEYVDKEVS